MDIAAAVPLRVSFAETDLGKANRLFAGCYPKELLPWIWRLPRLKVPTLCRDSGVVHVNR